MLSVLFFSHLCYTNETKGTQENTTIWRYLPCMKTQTKGSNNTDNSPLASNPRHMDNNNMNSNNMVSKLRMDLNPHLTASNNMGSSLMASSRSMDSLSCNTPV